MPAADVIDCSRFPRTFTGVRDGPLLFAISRMGRDGERGYFKNGWK